MAEISIDQAVAIKELQAELAFKHGVDSQQRCFWICGEINDKMLKHVEGCLTILENDSSKAITVRINSGGGECYSALAIVSRMQRSKCKIKTEGHGHVMSAATLILAAGHKRSISKWASFMWHEPSYGVGGRQTEAEAWVEQYKRELETWCELMSSLSSQSVDFWKEAGKHIDKFYSPEQLVQMGVVDSIF